VTKSGWQPLAQFEQNLRSGTALIGIAVDVVVKQEDSLIARWG